MFICETASCDTLWGKFNETFILDLNHRRKQTYMVEKELKNLIKDFENT